MTAIGQQRLGTVGIPHPHHPVTPCRGDTVALGFPGNCEHPAGMGVIGAKYCSYGSSSRGGLAERLRGWRCAVVIFCQSSLLEHMEYKTRSILCGLLLVGIFFVPICPITDGLDQDPIDFIVMGC